MMKRFNWMGGPLFAAEDEGGSGGAGAPPEGIMFAGEQVETAGEDQAGTEEKEAAEDTATEGDGKDAGDKKPAEVDPDAVPEDGKYTLTMPEGVEMDTELAEALGGDFKELGLTNAQAQKLADKFIAVQKERGAKQSEAWGETISGWLTDAKADKDMGGAKWSGTVETANAFVKEFVTQEGLKYFNDSGAGNHPEMIRMANSAGKAIAAARADVAAAREEIADLKEQLTAEDKPATGGAGGSSQPANPETFLFPTEKKG